MSKWAVFSCIHTERDVFTFTINRLINWNSMTMGCFQFYSHRTWCVSFVRTVRGSPAGKSWLIRLLTCLDTWPRTVLEEARPYGLAWERFIDTRPAFITLRVNTGRKHEQYRLSTRVVCMDLCLLCFAYLFGSKATKNDAGREWSWQHDGRRKVLAPGANSFSWTVSMEKRRIWIVAPDAYQNAPLIPYCSQPQTTVAIQLRYA